MSTALPGAECSSAAPIERSCVRTSCPLPPDGWDTANVKQLSKAEPVEVKTATAYSSENFSKWEWAPTGLLLIVMAMLLLLEATAGISVATRINVAVSASSQWLSVPCALLATFLGPLGAFLGWRRARFEGQAVPHCLQSAAGGALLAAPLVVFFFAPFWV